MKFKGAEFCMYERNLFDMEALTRNELWALGIDRHNVFFALQGEGVINSQ